MLLGSIILGFMVIALGAYIAHRKKKKELRELKKCLRLWEVELLKMEKRKVSFESINRVQKEIAIIRLPIEKRS